MSSFGDLAPSSPMLRSPLPLTGSSFKSRPKAGMLAHLVESISKLRDEGLVRRIAAGHEVFVTVLLSDRISVKLSDPDFAGMNALIETYDQLEPRT